MWQGEGAIARGEVWPTLGCTFGTRATMGRFSEASRAADTVSLAGDADVGEEWSEREESSGSGQFPPKGHHLATSLVPDTFINRIAAIP